VAEKHRRSALERHYQTGRYGASVAVGVTLVERRGLAMVQVNGAREDEGPARLASQTSGDATLLWTGPGQWFVVSERTSPDALVAHFEERLSSSGAAVTDLSHARTVVRVTGDAWRELRAKGCPADVDAMKSGDCIESHLSHFSVVIHCVAEDAVDIYVFRSFGASLWEWLRGGAEEFGYEVLEVRQPA